MISHLSIKQRHERPAAGIWTITNREEVSAIRQGYRLLRKEGASKFAARSVIANTLRAGRYCSSYTPTVEQVAS